MTTETDIKRDSLVEEARAFIDQLAIKLCARVDPLAVGGSFLAVGMALITGVMGKDGASRHLRALADELDGDDDPGWGGSA